MALPKNKSLTALKPIRTKLLSLRLRRSMTHINFRDDVVVKLKLQLSQVINLIESIRNEKTPS